MRFGKVRWLADIDTRIYTSLMSRATAKLFTNGGSQAVRLPKECRFPGGATEVYARREGKRVVLELRDEWPEGFFESLRATDTIERPGQQPLRSWKNPFEAELPRRRRAR